MSSLSEPSTMEASTGHWLWDRKLYHYPSTPARIVQLVLAVSSTIVLYIQLYAAGAVSPLLSAQMHMSFMFLVTMIAITNLIGAFGSLAAGLADRLGRVNMIIWGMLVVGILTAFVVPQITDRYWLGVVLSIIGFIEGMLLVATPALVRDYSPQVGRAAAMGIWNVGPVAGSLIVSILASTTLAYFHNAWGSQFQITGAIGLLMFVIALFTMKELSPEIRDQLMVDDKDRELLEARAASGKVEINLDKPFSQLFKLDIIGPSIGFSTLLLLYFTLVGFSPILYATVFHFNASEANGVAAWAWAANVVVTLFIGFLFDWSLVRKPWMLVGGVLTIIFELILLFNIGNPLSFAELSILTAFMSGSFGFAAVAFYASFTETIEARNPALTATGLAIWAWIVRIVAFIAFLIIPHIVTSATVLLEGHAGSPDYEAARTAVYGEWRTWLWYCVAGVVFFMVSVFLHRGPWKPSKAREMLEAHDRQAAEELANLQAAAQMRS